MIPSFKRRCTDPILNLSVQEIGGDSRSLILPGMTTTVSPQHSASSAQYCHQWPNGLTLVAEKIESVQSAAMTLLVAAGASTDPSDALGSANVLADWVMRGAGSRDNRALTDYLDSLGVQRATGAETVFMRFSASMLARNLPAVLEVYADIVQRPQLPEAGFAPARDLAMQQIDAIEDEPSQKLNLMLRARHLPEPFGRAVIGRKDHLVALTASALRQDCRERLNPRGAILAVAGNIDFHMLHDLVEKCFAGWAAQPSAQPLMRAAPRGVQHITQSSNQVQIGLAYDTVCESDPESLLAQMAVGVLSGGMGARLFSEIREKQGLCYAVHAGYMSLKSPGPGVVIGYAGTVPDRAQRTLDSFLVELKRLGGGVSTDELERTRVGMKSRVIMQGESSASRAAALAADFHYYGRTRTLDELRTRIEAVTLENLNSFLASHPPEKITVVTIGPAEPVLTVNTDI